MDEDERSEFIIIRFLPYFREKIEEEEAEAEAEEEEEDENLTEIQINKKIKN